MNKEMIKVELDSEDDEYMYPKPGESDAEFEARMSALSRKLDARMSDEQKKQVDEFMMAVATQTA